VTLSLLDSEVVSDLIRRPQGIVATHIVEVGESTVCTSLVAAAELRFGTAKRASRRLTERVELILSRDRAHRPKSRKGHRAPGSKRSSSAFSA
jgi:tRNA(fMet)-specific endonuclease VapC